VAVRQPAPAEPTSGLPGSRPSTRDLIKHIGNDRAKLDTAAEHRPFVKEVAKHLATTFGEARVLYDDWYDAEFARLGLDVELPNLYRTQSELIALCSLSRLQGHFRDLVLVLLALSEDLYLTNKLLGILFRPSEVLLIGTQSMVPSEYRL
jgi:hypothetical protein